MFGFKTVVTPQNALKMTYFCSSWPTLCWILLKLHYIYIALGLECHRFLWMSFTVLAFSIVYAIISTRHYRARQRKMALMNEQKINRQNYEQSMDNLMQIRSKEKHLEQYDKLFLDLLNAPSSFPLSEKKSHSFSNMPRKIHGSSSTDIFQACSSTSTQTMNIFMNPEPQADKNEVRTIQKLDTTIGSKWGNTLGPKWGSTVTLKEGFSVVPKLCNTLGIKPEIATTPKLCNSLGPKTGNTLEPKVGFLMPSKMNNVLGPKPGNILGPISGKNTATKSPYTLGRKAGTALGLNGRTVKPDPAVASRSASNTCLNVNLNSYQRRTMKTASRPKKTAPIWRH